MGPKRGVNTGKALAPKNSYYQGIGPLEGVRLSAFQIPEDRLWTLNDTEAVKLRSSMLCVVVLGVLGLAHAKQALLHGSISLTLLCNF